MLLSPGFDDDLCLAERVADRDISLKPSFLTTV